MQTPQRRLFEVVDSNPPTTRAFIDLDFFKMNMESRVISPRQAVKTTKFHVANKIFPRLRMFRKW